MATADLQLQDQLALVSSLYGPGTINCWYLTTLSVLVSWTLHPQKRMSGSIDIDLIAILTLPAVAAGHLISQVREILNQATIVRPDSSADGKFLQSVAAIEAPFNVTETFMLISVILFIVPAWAFCIRRAILVALIRLLCFAAECYIHLSEFKNLGLRYKPRGSADNYPVFSRLFVADYAWLLIANLVMLSLCGLISAAVAFFMLLPSRTTPSDSRQDIERINEATPREGLPFRFGAPALEVSYSFGTTRGTPPSWRYREKSVRWITMVTTLFLPVSFVLSLLPLAWHSNSHRDFASATTSSTRLGRDLFPRTACSISDLDQVVAAVAGATILGFSIYSVAKAYYKIWSLRRTTSGPTNTELRGSGTHSVS